MGGVNGYFLKNSLAKILNGSPWHTHSIYTVLMNGRKKNIVKHSVNPCRRGPLKPISQTPVHSDLFAREEVQNVVVWIHNKGGGGSRRETKNKIDGMRRRMGEQEFTEDTTARRLYSQAADAKRDDMLMLPCPSDGKHFRIRI